MRPKTPSKIPILANFFSFGVAANFVKTKTEIMIAMKPNIAGKRSPNSIIADDELCHNSIMPILERIDAPPK